MLCGGHFSPNGGVLRTISESGCQNRLADQQLHQLLEKVDWDLAEQAHQQGCLFCRGKLHRADYDRKPRGGPEWDYRYSFCCAQEGCRRRRTPESVRFMGRRVYAGLSELVRANHSTRGANENSTLGQLLGYERASQSEAKAYLHQTEHSNALPASWRCPG